MRAQRREANWGHRDSLNLGQEYLSTMVSLGSGKEALGPQGLGIGSPLFSGAKEEPVLWGPNILSSSLR